MRWLGCCGGAVWAVGQLEGYVVELGLPTEVRARGNLAPCGALLLRTRGVVLRRPPSKMSVIDRGPLQDPRLPTSRRERRPPHHVDSCGAGRKKRVTRPSRLRALAHARSRALALTFAPSTGVQISNTRLPRTAGSTTTRSRPCPAGTRSSRPRTHSRPLASRPPTRAQATHPRRRCTLLHPRHPRTRQRRCSTRPKAPTSRPSSATWTARRTTFSSLPSCHQACPPRHLHSCGARNAASEKRSAPRSTTCASGARPSSRTSRSATTSTGTTIGSGRELRPGVRRGARRGAGRARRSRCTTRTRTSRCPATTTRASRPRRRARANRVDRPARRDHPLVDPRPRELPLRLRHQSRPLQPSTHPHPLPPPPRNPTPTCTRPSTRPGKHP